MRIEVVYLLFSLFRPFPDFLAQYGDLLFHYFLFSLTQSGPDLVCALEKIWSN
jgi:hypothetical protein